jgi:hypothetical protein
MRAPLVSRRGKTGPTTIDAELARGSRAAPLAVRASQRISSVCRTGVALVVLPPALIVASLWVVLLAVVHAPDAWIDRTYTGFARLALGVAGTRVSVRGLEHVEPGRAYVVVATFDDRERLRIRTHAVVAGLRTSARRRLRALGVEPGGID